MEFQVTPQITNIDQPIAIILKNVAIGAEVTIQATMTDADGVRWYSWGKYIADQQGEVNLAKQKPVSGTYENVDVNGLMWSMVPVAKKYTSCGFVVGEFTGLKIKLFAKTKDKLIAVANIERIIRLPNILCKLVKANNIVGWFYRLDTEKKYPAILLIPGVSGTRPLLKFAGLLASYGYATLILAYRNESDLLSSTSEIPLEKIMHAAQWLRQQPCVDANRIGALSFAKGSEYLLAAVSYMPDINLQAIVACHPSNVIWQDVESDKTKKQFFWLYQGKPLPCLSHHKINLLTAITKSRLAKLFNLNNFFTNFSIRRIAATYVTALQNKIQVEQARIPVENIRAPIMLVTEKRDIVMPYFTMGKSIMDTFDSHNFLYDHELVTYNSIGCEFSFPGIPTTKIKLACGPLLINSEDTPENIAKTQSDFWQKILAFFGKHL